MRRRLWVAAALVVTLALAVALTACNGGGGGGSPMPDEGGPVTPTPFEQPGGRLGSEVTPPAVTPGSGDGPQPEGSIVFLTFRDGDREIYSINVDGSDPKNLTNDPGVDENPDVSRDGKKIVWASDRDGGTLHLYSMDIDGSDVKQLTFDPGGDNSPRWSPDGSKIAFTRGGGIFLIDADGRNEQEIFASDAEATADQCKAGAFPGGWSPDGTKITYYSASVSRGIGEVCTVDADGSNVTVVVGDPPVYNVEPTWSPDGRYLAFRSIRGGNHDVYTYDFETDEVRRLTDFEGLDIEPSWSPDGEWIVFASGRNNDFTDIYIMRKDGSDVRQVSKDPDKDSEPIWVP